MAAIASMPAVTLAVSHAAAARTTPSSVPSYTGLASSKTLVVTSRPARAAVGLPALKSRSRVVCAVGDVSPDSTNYLIGGAIAVALLGTAFPLLFSRKDLCPVCDGAGFVRSSDKALNAYAASKKDQRIVCPNCKGLGKINQVDK